MRAKFLYLVMISLCISSVTTPVQAEDYYSSQTTSGYYSSNSQEHHKRHPKKHDEFSISVNLPAPNSAVVMTPHGIHRQYYEPQWISMRTGARLPNNAVIGGGQPNPPATLFVCRAYHHGGLHPGKLFNGRCNISWGGSEISMSRYEVLVSRSPLHWIPASYGRIPPGAIQGGYEQTSLFICQANYHGGTHAGKIVGQNCNFGWGGNEITIPFYNVLVR
ncbi:MAG: DUF3421 domain-containing protein [Gammaproteobacteria bacterium]|nr:DUF3421 domain-containing protein [Gammaproteobacteria bacterium]MCW5583613.1 DUF3421 domain-containing protein [Gammaproteobacteria bacterium]